MASNSTPSGMIRDGTQYRDIKLCTFNCRSVKRSFPEVRQLCNNYDLVLVQEHWLMPDELQLLSNIHPDFLACGASAVDTSRDILVGRPYGGTAILYRKSLADHITLVHGTDSRITAVRIHTRYGSVLVVNVYMPTEYHNEDSLEQYTETCGKINALIIEHDVAGVILAGDFNCSVGSRFYDTVTELLDEHKLVFSDLKRLNSAFTYSMSDMSCTSWIDHVACSKPVDNIVSNVQVLYDYVLSDHKPLSVTFGKALDIIQTVQIDADFVDSTKTTRRCWESTDDFAKYRYASCVDSLLQNVSVPSELWACLVSGCRCPDSRHCSSITEYYNNVLCAIEYATEANIPCRTFGDSSYNVPGWNDYVDEKHNEARNAYLEWLRDGKPRFGVLFQRMQRTRANFKLAFRYCRQHEQQLRADACAINLKNKDPIKFWHSVKKISNSKATKYVSTVDGVTGEQNIAEMWKNHFAQLYNSVNCDSDAVAFTKSLSLMGDDKVTVSIGEVVEAIGKQKKGKSAGPDSINSEAYIYGGIRLATHLCILFNLFITHSFLPDSFMSSTIIPLIKCKTGDLTDINNYRAITLSNAVTKILECILLAYVKDKCAVVDSQFGFKSGHSTSLCTHSFKFIVDYYTNRGSHLFVCFADFTKAFDRVNYWKLFNRLLEDGLSASVVSLLAFWYSHQHVMVQWRNTVSSSFSIGNGTKQGGVLSPCLFISYISKLICNIIAMNIGCNIGGMFMNILAYADDVVLLAPSWFALQQLIDALECGAGIIDMQCNANKTVCMVFPPKDKRKIVASAFPSFVLNGATLQYVSEFKYLGHMISNDNTDDKDMLREVRLLFVRANILNRRFGVCSVPVKLTLFRSFCICFYGMALWKRYSVASISRLRSSYIKCMKLFFGYSKYYSVTSMLVQLGLPSFDTLIFNSRVSLSRQCQITQNAFIGHICRLYSV